MSSLEFIFVYGTLRRNAAHSMHSVMARHCRPVSEAYMQGRLYEVGAYPGAVESNKTCDKVYGELYEVLDSSVFYFLDDYEECTDHHPKPHEYIRKELKVSFINQGCIQAWVYVYNRDVSNLKRIASGDYLSFVQTQA